MLHNLLEEPAMEHASSTPQRNTIYLFHQEVVLYRSVSIVLQTVEKPVFSGMSVSCASIVKSYRHHN